jgi:hypothetical protein
VTCTPADDAFLVEMWPGVVVRTGERWLIAIDPQLAQTGVYTVTMGGLPYQYPATVPPDSGPTIVAGLLTTLSLQVQAAASPQGLYGILLQEVPPPPPAQPAGLAVTVDGPAPDAITATLVSGGDGNAAARAFWLDAVLCSLPPCCVFGACQGDYTRMHAALAAHWIYSTMPQNVGSTGGGANDFERMRLGPAELSRGLSAWGANGNSADGDLAKTIPGQYFLALRAKYIFPFVCV